MSNYSNNNKRLAKNTVYLYLRMILTMAIGLYTSRVVLKTLGVSDYGVYNVTGGLIAMLTYVNTILAGGTSRFLTIALGKNNPRELKKLFYNNYFGNGFCIIGVVVRRNVWTMVC